MERGAYITDLLDLQSETQPKFKRFNIHEPRAQSKPQLKKIRQANRTSKNINNFVSEQYYDNKKIKPGISFYKVILQNEELRKKQPNLPTLNINLPQTLLAVDNSYSLVHSNNTLVKVTEDYHFSDFLTSLQNNNSKMYPCAMTGIGNGHLTELTILLSNQLDSRLPPKNQNQLSSRYVPPFGGIPNSLRIFYTPKNVRNSKPNYAYKAISKKPLTQQLIERKHKQLHNYIIDYSKEQQIILTLVQGKALKQIEIMTQSIINYLEFGKSIKITEIVVDWIFGEDRKYYLQDIKSIKSVNTNAIWETNLEQLHKQQTNQTLCKLCNFSYPRNQITKLVTNKLILELMLHLKTRNISLPCHIASSTSISNLSNSSYVCDLCYELIVAEHRLIDIENQFQGLMNVGGDSIVRVRDVDLQRPLRNTTLSSFNSEQCMVKWRMMFYLQNVKNVPIAPGEGEESFVLGVKFSDVKESFQKRVVPQGQILFHMSRSQSANLSKSKNSYNSCSPMKKPLQTLQTNHTNTTTRTVFPTLPKQSTISFQKIKLLTFYTKTDDISQIIMNQDIQFQFGFRNLKFKGQSSTLQNFTNKKQCQRHSCEVLLFNQKFQYCNLQVNVGIICDGRIASSSVELTKSQKGHLYFASYEASCSPLPEEWIEVISEGMTMDMVQSYEKKSMMERPKSGFIQSLGLGFHSKISEEQEEDLF